jgi:uncharacterized membrane protein YphA (DoxX/SURF4 family)
MQLLPWITLALRIWIGGFFVFAAVDKVLTPAVFATSISHYGMVPNEVVNIMALVLPWLELVAGVLLILGVKVRASALLCALMLVMFTGAVAWAVINGLDIDCGCFGAQGAEEVSWWKVAKNSAMILGCLVMVWRSESRFTLESIVSGARS